jgi:NAD(P)-dependent dehydrogenase (short-subunit alcohol dehydrogenase family)
MAIPFSFDDIPDQAGRTAVVTGASSGLGLIAAAQLAARGAKVIMAVRSPEKGHRVRAGLRGDLEVHEVDLADLESVRRFSDRLHEQGRAVDVLVNNAGTGGQAAELTAQGFERVFATNHLGHFALTGLLLDLFRPDHDPRVVTVGSNFYRWLRGGLNFDDLDSARSFRAATAYPRAKLAQILFGAELDRRLRAAGSPVRSFLAHPGMASTPMHDAADGLAQRLFLSVGTRVLARSAEEGTFPLLYAAVAADAPTGVMLGPSLRKSDKSVHVQPLVPPGDDPTAAARLWSVSEDLTGVSYLPSADRAQQL